MDLIFIGSGSAFTLGADNYNSNILIVDPKSNAKLLIDCGSDARHALYQLGYSYRDITDVYISHLHADHVGGMEWLGLSKMFDPREVKPNLYGNEIVLHNLWSRSLSGGMRTLTEVEATLDMFFNVHAIEGAGQFTWQGIVFQLVKTIHMIDNLYLVPTYGLFFEINGTKIFQTNDTIFDPSLYKEEYPSADIIFHDCETAENPSGVHSHFNELKTLDQSLKAKMWLYHYNPGPLPDAAAHGFKGFVKRGQLFKF